MKKVENEWDEYGKQLLAPLRDTPPLDSQIAMQEKRKFLLQGENYRENMKLTSPIAERRFAQRIVDLFRIKRPLAYAQVLLGVFAALVILIGSSATAVYAAQSSLPGEPLYFIKAISEDIRISLTSSPQAKLNLTLDYTDKRMDEISSLVSNGKAVPSKASERFDDELESALILASQMDDAGMQKALGKIIRNAESQGITIEELINKLPDQAQPAIVHLQQRLQEQVDLSQKGTEDPTYFRTQMRERQRHHPAANKSNHLGTPTPEVSGTPGKGKGHDGKGQPSDVPGHDVEPPGQGKPTPKK